MKGVKSENLVAIIESERSFQGNSTRAEQPIGDFRYAVTQTADKINDGKGAESSAMQFKRKKQRGFAKCVERKAYGM